MFKEDKAPKWGAWAYRYLLLVMQLRSARPCVELSAARGIGRGGCVGLADGADAGSETTTEPDKPTKQDGVAEHDDAEDVDARTTKNHKRV